MSEASMGLNRGRIRDIDGVLYPSVRRLLQQAIRNGAVSEARILHTTTGRPSRGEYNVGKQTLDVYGSDVDAVNRAVVHEVIHAMPHGKKGRAQRIYDRYKELGTFDRMGVVFPNHWASGEMEGAEEINRNASQNDLTRWASETLVRRTKEVEKTIPENYSYSGLTSKKPGEVKMYWPNDLSEGNAYYLSKPHEHKALSELGSFLFDYGLGDKDVEGVLDIYRPEQLRKIKARHVPGAGNVRGAYDDRAVRAILGSGKAARKKEDVFEQEQPFVNQFYQWMQDMGLMED